MRIHTMKPQAGKVFTIFLIIFATLLISLTAISMFFFQKEVERRKEAEIKLAQTQDEAIKLDADAKELSRQKFLLEEKSKEADEKINSLLDELELEEGLRSEVKTENSSLKEKLAGIAKEESQVEQKLATYQQKMNALKDQLVVEMDKNKSLNTELVQVNKALEELKAKKIEPVVKQEEQKDLELDVELEKIDVVSGEDKEEDPSEQIEEVVVIPDTPVDGRILNVDKETEFVIINLGKRDGIKEGYVLSVYRGKEYLGDIQVTRVQPEMSAADLLPPFSSRVVRKNDQVTAKK